MTELRQGRRDWRAQRLVSIAGALVSAFVAAGCAHTSSSATRSENREELRTVQWLPWEGATFDRARAERKLVVVSVQAGWCHWCHVMNATTYRDPQVLALFDAEIVAIRVDADARPDLAERFAEWGWPATIVLSPDATPAVELRGFQPTRTFLPLLSELVRELRQTGRLAHRTAPRRTDDPAVADLDATRGAAREQLDGLYDARLGGWGTWQKYPFAAPVEFTWLRAQLEGDDTQRARALATLEGHARLIDRVWGGMYQYSVRGRWDAPHFEKIVPVQAGALESFADAYAYTGDARWLREAQEIVRYVDAMLSEADGGFYASQDADLGTHDVEPSRRMRGDRFYALDDAGRRALGVPHVDANVYARETAMLATAYLRLAAVRGDARLLERARRALERLSRTHFERGLFHHGATDRGVFHLSDQIEVARAYLALYEVSAEPIWLARLRELVARIRAEFEDTADGGFYAHTVDPAARGLFAERRKPLEDNARLARVLLSLARLDSSDALRDVAANALRAISSRSFVREHGRKIGDYAIALELLHRGSMIFSVVGPAGDPRTVALHRAALAARLPNAVVEVGRPGASRYPYPGQPAIYLCSADACSMPLTDPSIVAEHGRDFARDST